MPIEDYDIVGSYNNQRVSEIDAERSVNVFEYHDPLGKKPKCLINTSGLINTGLNFPSATGGFRAQWVFSNAEIAPNVFSDIELVVIDDHVYTIINGSVSLQAQTLSNNAGYIGIESNTFQIILVNGANGYIYDTIANTFVKITDPAFPVSPVDVCYLDGFFIVADANTNSFEMSSYEQGLTWGPAANNFTTNFAVNSQLTIGASTIGGPSDTTPYQTGVQVTVSNSGGSLPAPLMASTIYFVIQIDATHIELATTYANAIAGTFIHLTNDGSGTQTITSEGQLQQGFVQSHPGTLVGCRTLHRRVFFFSQFFTEVWENAGIGTTLPIRRNNSLLIEYGTPAVGSISVGFDTLLFLSQSRDGLGPVMQILGTQAVPISTRALDFQLAQYASAGQVADCIAFLIKENGIIFYRMNFTLANHTFVYNVTQSNLQADQTKFWHEEEDLMGNRHWAQTHAYFNGNNYVGHFSMPILYQIDPNTYTNDGQNIRRMRIGRAITPPGYQRIRVDRLQFDLLQGAPQDAGDVFFLENLDTENMMDLLTEGGDNILLETAEDESNPVPLLLFLSISKDGGQTYGYRLTAPMGAIGQRTFRTLYRKLGTTKRGQGFVPRIEFFEPVPFILLGAAWFYEILPE